MLCLSICFISFMSLFFFSIFLFLLGFYFLLNGVVYFVEWDIITLNSGSVVMTFLFDWMSLLFMGFFLFYFFIGYFM